MSFAISSPDTLMFIILTWSFPGVDFFTFFISLIISSPIGSSFNKSLASISVSSFTVISISSLGFSNLSPVSFSKCALNFSLVIVVPPVFCVPSFRAISGRRTLFLYFPRCSLPRTLYQLMLSLFLAALSSSLACHISSSISPTLALLLSAGLIPLSVQLVISFCIWLISSSLRWTLALCCFFPSRIYFLCHTSSATSTPS